MARTTPTVEPTTATAGDTWKWTASSSTYPVSEGWVLSYDIRGASKVAWDTGWIANDGTLHTITIPPASTLTVVGGVYEFTRVWTGSGSYSGERYTEILTPLVVLPDPTTSAAGERQSQVEIDLACARAAYSKRLAGDTPEEYQIGGRSVVKVPLKELERTIARLEGQLWRLRHPGVGRRKAAVRFSRPTA